MAVTVTTLDRRVARRLLRDAYARSGQRTTIRLMDSGSMTPLLRGEKVLSVRWGIPSDDIGPGAIVIVDDGVLFAHRLAFAKRRNGDRHLLQIADNFRVGDPCSGYWVDARDALGVVEVIEEPDGSRRVRLGTRRARISGRIVAALSWAVWRSDQTSRLRPLAHVLRAIAQRPAVRIVAVVLRLGGSSR